MILVIPGSPDRGGKSHIPAQITVHVNGRIRIEPVLIPVTVSICTEGLPPGILQIPIRIAFVAVQIRPCQFQLRALHLEPGFRLFPGIESLNLGNLRRQRLFQARHHVHHKIRHSRILLQAFFGLQRPAGHIHTGIGPGAVQHGLDKAHAFQLFNIIIIHAANGHISAYGQFAVGILHRLNLFRGR